MFLQGYVGQPTNVSMITGTPFNFRGGQMSDLIVSQLQGRFYENTYRGNVFSNGMGVNALAATTAIPNIAATTTPILGLYNPGTSTVNAVILQATLQFHAIAGSAVDPGAFIWCTSTGNNAITTGSSPFNRKTMGTTGSQCKGMAFVALTGISNNVAVAFASSFDVVNTAMPATAVCFFLPAQVQNFDGCLIIPPGGVLALLNSVSVTTVSVAGNLTWAEVPI